MSDSNQTNGYQDWVGRELSSEAVIDAVSCERLAATLGVGFEGDTLPPCWHWLYHLDAVDRSGIREDGHAAAGEFLPPIPAKRRMFAGSKMRFRRPVRIGSSTTQRQTISRIERKSGRQGEIWFVTVALTLSSQSEVLLEEEKTIVLLHTAGGPRAGQKTEMTAQWSETEQPDAVMLFRYSALTFNAHRIHYDREYTTGIEGYPERLIHGPLQAMLLALKAEQWAEAPMQRFAFRSLAPAFLGDTLTMRGGRSGDTALQLEIQAQDGIVTTSASADFEPVQRR